MSFFETTPSGRILNRFSRYVQYLVPPGRCILDAMQHLVFSTLRGFHRYIFVISAVLKDPDALPQAPGSNTCMRVER